MRNLVFYLTLHYPNRKTFFEILELLDRKGAGYVEIGIPVSDPYLDGRIIRQTHEEALRQKISFHELVHTLEEIRRQFAFKVVLMTYKEGIEVFQLSEVPTTLYDGLLCVDKEFPAGAYPSQIQVIQPFFERKQIAKALADNKLFAYVISGGGKTGSFDRLPSEYRNVVKNIKAVSCLPAFVGFGVKSPEDVQEVMTHGADGAIIGTEFIRRFQLGGMEALDIYLNELSQLNSTPI